MMHSAQHLQDLLERQKDSGRTIRFIHGGDSAIELTFAELWTRSGGLASGLIDSGCRAGDALIISTRSNEHFVLMFWACVRANMVPVPVAVGTTDEHRRKLTGIQAQLPAARLFADADKADGTDISWAEISNWQDATAPVAIDKAAGLALIQYSSGSTGRPKGVMLTHENLLINMHSIATNMGWTENDRGLSWMPLTHDMGLIVMHLCFVLAGMDHAIIDTDVFVRRPLLWLEEASRLKSTVLCSPNFGYKHFLKVFNRRGSTELDLRSVRTLFNGAEPISDEQCRDFNRIMVDHGLSSDAMLPVYGLAEATVGVSIPPHDRRYSVAHVNRHHLNIGDYCREIDADDPDAISFVRVGKPIDNVEVRIADDQDTELAFGHVGHVQIRGGSVTSGYLGDSPESDKTYVSDDGWLRTGDCGAINEGQLIITGRLKDVIIVNGQNYYAHDLEDFANAIEALELGKVAIVGAIRPTDTVEQVVVFLVYRGADDGFEDLAERVSKAILSGAGIDCDWFVPVPRIPKTTSGKVQRAILARNFSNGEYDASAVQLRQTIEDPAASGPADTLSQLLGIAGQHSGGVSLSADDDLFDAGISSLTLTEIVLAFEEIFPGKVSIDELFDYPTLRKLAAHIDEATDS